MLPVVAGKAKTQRQILIYTLLLVPIAVSLWPLGFAGWIYGPVAVATGAIMIMLALRLRAARATACEPAAKRLFAFSILYLFLLFAALFVEERLAAFSSWMA
jgi:protoheme IX farnesyltransferase